VPAFRPRTREPRFSDRREAGRLLAAALSPLHRGRDAPLVLALPRGGVPVGFEVADALGLELDAFAVRKLGVPGHEQLAMGALAAGGAIVIERALVTRYGVDEATLDALIARESLRLARRARRLRGNRPGPELDGRHLVLVDDGLATGSTMRAAIQAARAGDAARVTVAVPIAPAETCEEIREHADAVVCLRTPSPFYAVGVWYADFSPTSDAEAAELLRRAADRRER